MTLTPDDLPPEVRKAFEAEVREAFDLPLHHWILDEEGEPQAVDLLTWAHWIETADRIVLQEHPARGVYVSTVFLGLDYSFGSGPPVLWETMIFGGALNDYQVRHTSRLDALRGHAHALALVEIHRTAPRKTKKVLGKVGYWWRLRPREQRRLTRALRRSMVAA